MYEVLLLIGLLSFISLGFTIITLLTDDNINYAYSSLLFAAILLICYFVVDAHNAGENYTIENNSVVTDTLELEDSYYILYLPDSMYVEYIEYTLPLSTIWDYAVYRVYLDSTRYIELRTHDFDSSHVKYGKLKVDTNDD